MIGKIGKKKWIRQQKRKGNTTTNLELASCYGKLRYNTRKEAKIVTESKPDIVKSYKCKFCKFFHIGRKQ